MRCNTPGQRIRGQLNRSRPFSIKPSRINTAARLIMCMKILARLRPCWSRCEIANGKTSPTIKRNNGNIKSSQRKPCQSTWLNCCSILSATEVFDTLAMLLTNSPPPIIQNISNPRSASMDTIRVPVKSVLSLSTIRSPEVIYGYRRRKPAIIFL